MRKTGKAGKALIKYYEGIKLKAYLCPAGIPTIGYGHTKDVKMGMVITESQADEFFDIDLTEFELQVSDAVKVPLSQNQFDALVAFTYNEGIGNLKTSTLLKMINARDYFHAADQFIKWNKVKNPKTGVYEVCDGLTTRRLAEKKLFMTI